MRSSVVKRSVVLAGHKTSISVENEFWTALKAVSTARKQSMATIIASVDAARPKGSNLSSAVRLYVLDEVRKKRASGA